MAFIPGLLMLATFGLGRLESGLTDDTLSACDVADFLEHAEPVDMRTLAREGITGALDCLHRRQSERSFDELTHRPGRAQHPADPVLSTAVSLASEQPGLPPERHEHSRTDRQFEPPRPAHRM